MTIQTNLHSKQIDHIKTWLFCPKPNPNAKVKLICFPYAGGGTTIYRNWPNFLPAEIEVSIIRLPGRENRLKCPPFTQMKDLIVALINNIGNFFTTPYAFYGHSMGASIAFELTITLKNPPLHLFISGAPTPKTRWQKNPIHQLNDEDFLIALQQYQGTVKQVLENKELLELLLPSLRADFQLIETYFRPETLLLDCPISVFHGLDDKLVSNIQEWNNYTKNICKIRNFPGNHFFIHTAQAQILAAIQEDLFNYLK